MPSYEDERRLDSVVQTAQQMRLYDQLMALDPDAAMELLQDGFDLSANAPMFDGCGIDIGCDVMGAGLAYGQSRALFGEKVKRVFAEHDSPLKERDEDAMTALLERIGNYNGGAALGQAFQEAERTGAPGIGGIFRDIVRRMHSVK